MAVIIRSPEARLDAIDIWTYISRDSIEAADRLLDVIETKLRLLSESPHIGQSREELAPSLRSYAVGNFILFYRPVSNGIELVRILHGARNLRRLFVKLRTLKKDQ